LQAYNNAANRKISFVVPTVKGEAKVGHLLVVRFNQAVLDDGFASGNTEYTVNWKVGANSVLYGTDEEYSVTPADVGQKITVQYTSVLSTYDPTSSTSVETPKVIS
jgi:hypothetical protein